MSESKLTGPAPDSNGYGEPSRSREAQSDPFDPAGLRLTQDFAAIVSVKEVLLTVPVRKPDNSWHVRVHPDESYRLQTAVMQMEKSISSPSHCGRT